MFILIGFYWNCGLHLQNCVEAYSFHFPCAHSTFWARSFRSSPTADFLPFPSIYCQNIKWRFESCDNADSACFVCVCVTGVNSLCQSLSANPSIPSSLVHLDLSGNMLRGDDMQVLNINCGRMGGKNCQFCVNHLSLIFQMSHKWKPVFSFMK